MSNPPTRAWPEVGLSSVDSIRMSVVLPEPFGPSKPTTAPRVIRMSTSITAWTWP